MRFLIVLALASSCLAATPTTRPASPPGKSADGIAFPDVTCAIAKTDRSASQATTLADVADFLLRPPGDLDQRIFSTDKSSDMLAHRLGRVRLAPDWFGINILNSDAACLWLDDGVISRIALVYQRPADADADLGRSKGQRSHWVVRREFGAVILSVDATDRIDGSRRAEIEAAARAAKAKSANEIHSEYDRFKDQTTVRTPMIHLATFTGEGRYSLVMLQAFQGTHREEDVHDATLAIVRVGDDLRFMKYRTSAELILLLDEDTRLVLPIQSYDTKLEGGSFKEAMVFKITSEQIRTVLRAGKIEGKIGQADFRLEPGDVENLRRVADALGMTGPLN